VTGFLATLSLIKYSEIAAAITGTFTALWMMFKCFDWIEARILASKQRTKEKTK
jgi:hypothetical protein